MFAKLAVLILSLGLAAAAMLAARQARLLAAHDLAEARLRIMRSDSELWRLRAVIAAGVTPQRVEALASAMEPLKPMAVDLRPRALPAVAPGPDLSRVIVLDPPPPARIVPTAVERGSPAGSRPTTPVQQTAAPKPVAGKAVAPRPASKAAAKSPAKAKPPRVAAASKAGTGGGR